MVNDTRGNFIKETHIEQIDKQTGEVKTITKTTETIRGAKNLSYLLLNKTNGLSEIRGLIKNNKYMLFTLLAYNASPIDNTINTSIAMIDEIAMFMGVGRKRIQQLMKEMERDCYLIPIWGGKIVLHPSVFIFGGSKNYDKNMKLYERAVKWRSQNMVRSLATENGIGSEWKGHIGDLVDEGHE